MKKRLLIIGVVCLIVCVLALAYAALNWFGYYHVMDGSAELYHRLHQRAFLFFGIGIALAAIGTGCLIVRAKKTGKTICK